MVSSDTEGKLYINFLITGYAIALEKLLHDDDDDGDNAIESG